MNFSLGTLIVAGVAPTQARQFYEHLRAACERFEINTPARMGCFIGQMRVESADFTRLEENLNYRTPEVLDRNFSAVRGVGDAAALIRLGPQAIANRVYANRNGNGNEASGDGWRYRGRAFVQLTGRHNYSDASTETGRPYLEQPDLLLQPADAALASAWYWVRHGCNALADSAQYDAITRAINGPAMLHADLRRQYSQEGIQAFS